MQATILEALRQEIAAKEEFARANPLRFPGDPAEIDAILDIALRHPEISAARVLEALEQQLRRRPKMRVTSFLKRHRLLKADGREECLADFNRLKQPLLNLLLTGKTNQLGKDYEALVGWLSRPRRFSGPIVARLLLTTVVEWLRASERSEEERKLGTRLQAVQSQIKPVMSMNLLRKMIYRAAEVRGLRSRASLTDKVDELIGSLEDTTEAEPEIEGGDHESLVEVNADLRSALFGLKKELTRLKEEIVAMQATSQADALIELLAGMNSNANGRLLDNLTHSREAVMRLLESGWQPEPAEVEGVVYSLKMLVDYLERIGVQPMRQIGSREHIRLADLSNIDYVGSAFRDQSEVKQVEFRSTGWQYQGRIITRPQAVEVDLAIPAN